MRLPPSSARVFLQLFAILLSGAVACSSPTDPEGPPATGTVTGIVRQGTTAAPLAGATVRIGALSATSGADGRYTLDAVPVAAAAALSASLADHDDYSATVSVVASGTTHDVTLVRKTVWVAGTASAYIPRLSQPLRGVMVFFFGGSARGVADGNPILPDTGLVNGVLRTRAALLPFAESNRFALVGFDVTDAAAAAATVTATLQAIAVQSGHPELTTVPLFAFGASAGAPPAWAVVQAFPARTLAFWLNIAVTPTVDSNAETDAIPGFILLAELDATPGLNTGTTAFWARARANGARWGLAIERNRIHTALSPRAVSFFMQWLTSVHDLRSPAPGGAILPAVAEDSGWLGDRGDFSVANWAAFPGTRSSASWLTSSTVANAWRDFSLGSTP